MELYQLVYTSKNCIEGSPEQIEAEIRSILSKSRHNNDKANITGALLFNGEAFAQVLEGPLDAIEKTYERIQCDPRHSDVILLSNGTCVDRSFSDWSMAYADPNLVSGTNQQIDIDEICANPQGGGERLVHALHQLVSNATQDA